ncbi:MAG: tetratricopeptide repeat protein, partial [Planctomycetota bacterium]
LGLFVEAERESRRALELWDGRVAADDPDRRKAWTLTMGSLIAQDDARAAEWIERGLVEAEGLPEDDPFVLRLRNGQHVLAYRRGDYAYAVEEGHALWARARESLGPDHAFTLIALSNLVAWRAAQAVDDETLDLARELHGAFVRVHGETSFHALDQQLTIARLDSERGAYDAAREGFDAALPPLVALAGEEHPRVVVAMQDLALLHMKERRNARAIVLLERCLAISEATRGPEHSATLLIAANLATARGAIDDSRALESLREMLETHTQLWGAGHPRTVLQMTSLGADLTKRGQFDEAGPLLVEALARAREIEADDPKLVRTALHVLGYFYYTINDYERARPVFAEALERFRRELGASHPETLHVANNHVAALGRLGRYAEAIPVATEIVGVYRDTLPITDEVRSSGERNLAWLHSRAGNAATATELYSGILDEVLETRDDDDPLVAMAFADLGKALSAKGDHEDAVGALDEAIARAEFEPRVDRWNFAGWRRARAASLRRLDRMDEAESDLLVADEIVLTRFSPQDPNRRPVVEDLVELYEEWDRPDEATVWRATLEEIRKPPVR